MNYGLKKDRREICGNIKPSNWSCYNRSNNRFVHCNKKEIFQVITVK